MKPTLDDRETLRLSMDDRSGLAADTLVSAMDTLDDTWHTWEAEYGAKLETSFVGGLVLHFPAVFRKWQDLPPARSMSAMTSSPSSPLTIPLVGPSRTPLGRC